MLAFQVLNKQLDWKGRPPITDDEIESDCEQCGGSINLGSCRVEGGEQGTVYRCGECPEVVLIVAEFVEGTPAWPGRGYRLGGWVLRNPAELRFRGISVPASPNAAIKK